MRFDMSVLVALAALSLSACGFTSEGSGSQTLRVNTMVSYLAASSVDTSSVTAVVTRSDGTTVSDAVIELVNAENAETLATLSLEDGSNDTYYATFPGYHTRIQILVTSQDGNIDATLLGPSRHTIANPVNAQSLRRDDVQDGLDVSWHTLDGLRADEVIVRVPEHVDGFGEDDDDDDERYVYQTTLPLDSGSATIPADKLGLGTETVEVWRRNTVKLAGGTTGSIMGISYGVANNIEIVE